MVCIPCEVFESELDQKELMVYLSLCRLSENTTQVRAKTHKEIALTARLHPATVRKALKGLVGKGYITILRKDFRENRGTDHYILHHSNL